MSICVRLLSTDGRRAMARVQHVRSPQSGARGGGQLGGTRSRVSVLPKLCRKCQRPEVVHTRQGRSKQVPGKCTTQGRASIRREWLASTIGLPCLSRSLCTSKWQGVRVREVNVHVVGP